MLIHRLSQYSGPCPPVGDHAHHYEITVYAVKLARLPLDNTASGADVSAQLRSNALATANIVGRYERSLHQNDLAQAGAFQARPGDFAP